MHRVGECNVVYNYQKAKQTHQSDTPLPFNQTENERCLFLSPTRKKVRGDGGEVVTTKNESFFPCSSDEVGSRVFCRFLTSVFEWHGWLKSFCRFITGLRFFVSYSERATTLLRKDSAIMLHNPCDSYNFARPAFNETMPVAAARWLPRSVRRTHARPSLRNHDPPPTAHTLTILDSLPAGSLQRAATNERNFGDKENSLTSKNSRMLPHTSSLYKHI